MGVARRHNGRVTACVGALLIALLLPTAAAARPGALDRGFNGDGKLVTVLPPSERNRGSANYALPYEFAPGRVAMAEGSGRLVVASNRAIVRYLANGRRDRRFGGGGAVPIDPVEGWRFQLADVAIDSKRRVLVAGTSKPTEEEGLAGLPLPGPLPTVATISRYLPSGQLDPSFGAGGVLNTDLGAPPPTFEGGFYPESAVAVVGLTVDRANRPIVAGSAVAEVGRCGRSKVRYEASRGFVARLSESGALDPSFAGDGTREIGGPSWLGLPTVAGNGVLATGNAVDRCRQGGPFAPSVLVRISADGSLSPGFAGDGLWSRPFTRVSDLAAAPGGKVVLLTRTIELRRGRWIESAGRAVRLRRNGSFDRRFGRRGEAQVRLRRALIATLATDSRGRVLLAGTVRRKPSRKRSTHLEFLLIRTTGRGRVDRSFGRRGRVTTSFGARANVSAAELIVDQNNRITVGGKLSGPTSRNAFAIARYLGGR